MRKTYMKPGVDMVGLSTELAFMYSYDNTGNNGSDGEKGTVIEGDLDDGDEVGAKGHYWDYEDDYEDY